MSAADDGFGFLVPLGGGPPIRFDGPMKLTTTSPDDLPAVPDVNDLAVSIEVTAEQGRAFWRLLFGVEIKEGL